MSSRSTLTSLCVGVLAFLVTLPAESRASEEIEAPVSIRIGWQIPSAAQAQIVQVLERTDVLERHGLEPRLIPFSFGTPQVEAALAGRLDVFFAGDQPAINLLAHGGRWKIVARLMYDRVAVLVPTHSPMQRIEDLMGKTVASPFGSVAHREVIVHQESVGLDADDDVRNVDLDILEIRRRVLAKGAQSWGEIDAAAVWEPVASRLELEGFARPLATSRTLGVVVVSDEFIARHPEAAVQLLVALARSWEYFSRNPERVMRWYMDDAQLGYVPETLASAARLDPNFGARSLGEIDLRLHEEDIATLERGAAWGREIGAEVPRIRESVDQRLVGEAMQEIGSARFEALRIILPSAREAPASERGGYGLDAVPLGVMFASLFLAALLAIECGFRLGRRAAARRESEPQPPVATVVGAVLTMLAFVIALTFGSANNRFDARKEALIKDVNAIQTTYLRATLLPEPHRTTLRSLLRDYVQARVGMVYAYGQPETLRMVQRRAEALQESMWSHAESLSEENRQSRALVLLTSSLNDLINSHTARVVLGAHYRIPGFVWWSLIFASGVAMIAVGFQFGVGSGRRILMANIALATTFALVMLLVFDLDRAGEGLITVNQQPMLDLYRGMYAARR
jgi:ABC-type nitrate/sulfonate/bicarbonate transport system substrate-binding protein